MGFLKEFGKGLGEVVGTVTGEPVKWAGKKLAEHGNKEAGDWVKGVGNGIQTSTQFAGERLGETASGVYGLAEGTIKQDRSKQSQAFDDLSDGVGKTVKGVGHTIKHTATNVGEVAGGVMDGDEQRWKEGLKNVTTTAAVGVLGVSVLDAADAVDVNGNESGGQPVANTEVESTTTEKIAVESPSNEKVSVENPNSHHVDAHFVEGHWRDGQWIDGYWRDGDGNTNVDTYAGYEQSNPDYKVDVDRG